MRPPRAQQTELADPNRSTLVQAVQLVLLVERFAVRSNHYRQAVPMRVVTDLERPIHSHLD